jgi:hypothetical protein
MNKKIIHGTKKIPMCDLGPHIFLTDQAIDYKKDKCVGDVMTLMGGSTKQCVRHLQELSNDNGKAKKCTHADFENLCNDTRKFFTMEYAISLCEHRYRGEKDFWDDMKRGAYSVPCENTSSHNTAKGLWKKSGDNMCFTFPS